MDPVGACGSAEVCVPVVCATFSVGHMAMYQVICSRICALNNSGWRISYRFCRVFFFNGAPLGGSLLVP